MTRTKHIISIGNAEFLPVVGDFKVSGHRLVQICCVKEGDRIGLHYTFDREYSLVDLYFTIASDAHMPSITAHFPCAFLYENEIHDLYGISFDGINVDFKGLLYKLSGPRPFNPDVKGSSERKRG